MSGLWSKSRRRRDGIPRGQCWGIFSRRASPSLSRLVRESSEVWTAGAFFSLPFFRGRAESTENRSKRHFRVSLLLSVQGGSCRSLHWVSSSSSLVYESPQSNTHVSKGDRERQGKKDRAEEEVGRSPWVSRVGLLVGAFADDSLRLWSVPLDPFLDEDILPPEEENDEHEEKDLGGFLFVEGLGRQKGRGGNNHEVVFTCRGEDGNRKSRRHRSNSSSLRGREPSKGERKAFASEAERSESSRILVDRRSRKSPQNVHSTLRTTVISAMKICLSKFWSRLGCV